MTAPSTLPAALVLVLACGCASAPDPGRTSSWQGGPKGVEGASSGSEAERWFPMVDGTLYHYRTESLGDSPAPPGMLMLKVHRQSATQAELRRPSGSQSIRFLPDGVGTTTKTGAPAFVLKLPIDPKTQWLGPQGGVTRVVATGVTAEVPAGKFSNCLVTEEERKGDAPITIKTTLCPEVGIVSLQAQGGGGVERAELMYFGPPVEIGEEGLRRLE